MNVQDGGSPERIRKFWQEAVHGRVLHKHDPRVIVAACRRLDPVVDQHLLGALLNHLSSEARRILQPWVSVHLDDGGKDAMHEVVGAMLEAILTPDSADGRGLELQFRGRLQKRLIDSIRREKARRSGVQLFEVDEKSNALVYPEDGFCLGPEEDAVIRSVLATLPEMHRQAFLLRRRGFGLSGGGGECISNMLGVTPKTAKDWIRRAEERILSELGRTA